MNKKVTFTRRPVQVAQPKIGFFGRIFGFTKRKVAVAALILVMLGSSATAFAYWGGVIFQSQEEEQTISIGEGREATVSSSVSDNIGIDEVLVPVGQSGNSSNPALAIETVTFTYTVVWNDNLEGLVDGTLTTVIDNIQIGGDTTYAGLVNPNITTTPTTINVNDTVIVTIEVTLTEPADQTVYDAVKNQDITFDVTFTVVPN